MLDVLHIQRINVDCWLHKIYGSLIPEWDSLGRMVY